MPALLDDPRAAPDHLPPHAPYHPYAYPHAYPLHPSLPPPHQAAYGHPSGGYLPHRLPPPPALSQPPPPPPPPILQKVWILDCRTCGTFITNRGMKAVLLLRPNVALYSTDALPINCSAYHPSPSTPSSSSSHGRPAAPTKEAAPMPRTCDCLTQTLYCHGCGTGVGYMIVVPCARCTQSIGANNRATNGHRFVFHSSEISVCERHYIADEPGVHPAYTPQPAQSSPNPSLASMATSPMMHAPPSPVHMIVPSHREPRHRSSRSHPPVRAPQDGDEEDEEEDYDDMVPSDVPELVSGWDDEVDGGRDGLGTSGSFDSELDFSPPPPPPGLRPRGALSVHHQLQQRQQHVLPSYVSPSTSAQYHPYPQPHRDRLLDQYQLQMQIHLQEKAEVERVERLMDGDVLYWHQLVRSGEIPGVVEDERARKPKVENRRTAKAWVDR